MSTIIQHPLLEPLSKRLAHAAEAAWDDGDYEHYHDLARRAKTAPFRDLLISMVAPIATRAAA